MKPSNAFLSRNRVARAVAKHMQIKAGMGGALYTPDDPKMPVGSCASCHMAKIGKLQDIDVDAMYHLISCCFQREGQVPPFGKTVFLNQIMSD